VPLAVSFETVLAWLFSSIDAAEVRRSDEAHVPQCVY